MENTDLNFKDCFDRDVFKVYTENGSKSIALMYYVYQEGQKYPQVVWPERVTTLPVPVKENDVLDTWEAARQAQADLDEDFPDVEDEITHLPVLDIEKVDDQTEDGLYLDIKRY